MIHRAVSTRKQWNALQSYLRDVFWIRGHPFVSVQLLSAESAVVNVAKAMVRQGAVTRTLKHVCARWTPIAVISDGTRNVRIERVTNARDAAETGPAVRVRIPALVLQTALESAAEMVFAMRRRPVGAVRRIAAHARVHVASPTIPSAVRMLRLRLASAIRFQPVVRTRGPRSVLQRRRIAEAVRDRAAR